MGATGVGTVRGGPGGCDGGGGRRRFDDVGRRHGIGRGLLPMKFHDEP